ncbi:hypothetical protein B1R94_02315 [Mycolicibacterium litorale]|nr:hypothetical protein B1R94_02315 [Mycolicibacterium litorale]
MTVTLNPVVFDAPLVTPAPNGLYAATNWQPQSGPARWIGAGMLIRSRNYGNSSAFKVWTADWDGLQEDLGDDDVKTGVRPDDPDAYIAMTVVGADACEPGALPEQEIRDRAQQVLLLEEQAAAEEEFAARLLTDTSPVSVADIVAAVAKLEGLLAKTNTLGFIHASSELAAPAAQAQLIVRSGVALKTPLGHTWVFGGGYVGVDGLDQTLVATSQPYGWRTEIAVKAGLDVTRHNLYHAVAERSLLIGYEAAVGAATIT